MRYSIFIRSTSLYLFLLVCGHHSLAEELTQPKTAIGSLNPTGSHSTKTLDAHAADAKEVDVSHSTTVKYNSNSSSSGNQSDHHDDHHGDHEGHTDHGGHDKIHLVEINFEHVKNPLVFGLVVIIAGLSKIGFHHANFLSSKVPESCILILLGVVLGAIIHFSGIAQNMEFFAPHEFFLYLLPPIILEAAFSLHDRTFSENIGSIIMFSVVGTIIACFAIGFTLLGLNAAGAMEDTGCSTVQLLVFSALIVAVDPVAVLAIFQEVGVNNMLYFIVFGESLLNDGVTVVLYNVMQTYNRMDTIGADQVVLGIVKFFVVVFGGIALGVIHGLLSSFLTKYTNSVKVVEPIIIFGFAYQSYILSEMFHFSGIVSIIACGLTQMQYAFNNITNKSKLAVKFFAKVMSNTCEIIIFLFLGLKVVHPNHSWNTGFVLWTTLLCIVYRFIIVFLMSIMINRCDQYRVRKIKLDEMFMIFLDMPQISSVEVAGERDKVIECQPSSTSIPSTSCGDRIQNVISQSSTYSEIPASRSTQWTLMDNKISKLSQSDKVIECQPSSPSTANTSCGDRIPSVISQSSTSLELPSGSNTQWTLMNYKIPKLPSASQQKARDSFMQTFMSVPEMKRSSTHRLHENSDQEKTKNTENHQESRKSKTIAPHVPAVPKQKQRRNEKAAKRALLASRISKRKNRMNVEVAERERIKGTESRKRRRADKDVKERDRIKGTESRKRRREDEDVKERDRIKSTESRRQRRMDDNVIQRDRTASRVANRKRRLNEDVTERDRIKDTESRKGRRADEDVKERDRIKSTESRRQRRMDNNVTQRDRTASRVANRKRRLNEVVTERDRIKDTESRKRKRADEDVKERDRIKSTESRRQRRMDDNVTQRDRTASRVANHIRRLNKNVTERDRIKGTESRKRRRADEDVKERDRTKSTESRSKRRADEDVKERDRMKSTESHSRRRADEDVAKRDRAASRICNWKRRTDASLTEKDRRKCTERRQHQRKDPVVRHQERQSDIRSKRKKRLDNEFRQAEQALDTIRKTNKRLDPVFREKEKSARISFKHDAHKKHGISKQMIIDKFHETVSKGPVYVCSSCNQLMYRHSVSKNNAVFQKDKRDDQLEAILKKCLIGDLSSDGEKYVCTTFLRYLKKRKIPPCSIVNGMVFPDQGPLKHLNTLETTLLAPILPFMKIHEAPRGKQFRIHGNVVLVPANVASTVHSLPRVNDETATIKAKLKRRLRYKHHVYSLNIRPQSIRDSAVYLQEKGELYKEHNITFNLSWDTNNDNESEEYDGESILCENESNFLSNTDEANKESLRTNMQHDVHHIENCINIDEADPQSNMVGRVYQKDNRHEDLPTSYTTESQPDRNQDDAGMLRGGTTDEIEGEDSDAWSEVDDDELTAGLTDTMLTAPDFVEPCERDFVYSFAPAEGSRPISVFTELHAEELSHPAIFVGQARLPNNKREVPVSYSEIVKSELRNKDRRCARSIDNIFFKVKKLQMKYLIDQTNLAVRKIQRKDQPLTAKDVRRESAKNLIHLDQGYKVLNKLRGSPPYFQAIAKDLFAMIKHLGPATFFFTLSAAETRWLHLLRILAKIVKQKDLTGEELENLTWEEKCELIQSDPILCARHFDYSLQRFMKDVLFSELQPLGPITDWFYRIEFQQRGSPHVHMLIWCSNSPVYGVQDTKTVEQFVTKFISCHKPPQDSPLAPLVELQHHRHSKTCRKGRRKKCRFGFPKPPMPFTQLLEPLPKEEIPKHAENWIKISQSLNELVDGSEKSFAEYLSELELTLDQYIMAVQSSISSVTLFLKRSPSEIRINPYNTTCLKAWRANMDVQYVLDVYACAMYIASYVTKAQRGMSELLQVACREAREGNKNVKEQVRVIGNKFLNSVEISAQEAAYLALQLPLRRSSRQVTFINTSTPENRVILIKPQNQLDRLKDEDTEIQCSNIVSRYSGRPRSMSNLTLAEFASCYEKKASNHRQDRSISLLKYTRDDLLPEIYNMENENQDDEVLLEETQAVSKSDAEYRKRARNKILRYVHFNPDVDSELYFRELLMMYVPWRNEQSDILGNFLTYQERYETLKEDIEKEWIKYEPFHSVVTSAQQQLATEPNLDDAWDDVAPNTENADAIDRQQYDKKSRESQHQEEYDIGQDLGLRVTPLQDDVNVNNEMSDEEYRSHMRLLNKDQLKFIYDIIQRLKTDSNPIYHFLSGGAGVGKSFVIQALYQMCLKYYNRRAGENFTTSRVMLIAPTGKAAYHISGNTIHSAFKIAANQKLTHKALDSSSLNTLQTEIGAVKLVILDEVSMVGFRLFNCIHQRLMEVKKIHRDFGGVSLIAVGDFFQLKPVMDSYIFKNATTNYMALAENLWQKHFGMTELTQIMRQRDNQSFAMLLNRLREGKQTVEDIKCLQSRLTKPTDKDYPHSAAHLFITNQKVDTHNLAVFNRTRSTKMTVTAKDRVLGSAKPELREKIIQSFHNSSNTVQLHNSLELAEGLLYDITINLNTDDGLTNGASCKLKKIQIPSSSSSAEASGILWVEFLEEKTGRKTRQDSQHLYSPHISRNWTPISPSARQFAAGYKGEAQVQRIQFPLRPSAAKTIHRAQGDTLSDVVVDLTTKRKLEHMHYVALSRAKSLDGLHILNLQEDKISVSKEVQNEMFRLRSESNQQTICGTDKFKILFLNANSLNRHLVDVRADYRLTYDMMAFCETRFMSSDSNQATSIQGYHVYRQDSITKQGMFRPTYGIAVYSRQPYVAPSPISRNSHGIEISLVNCPHPIYDTIYLVFLYKPPKTPLKHLLAALTDLLNSKPTDQHSVIMGDFNVDWTKPSSEKRQLENLLTNDHNLRQVIQGPTTDDDTSIDLIFTDIQGASSGTLEVYYSPHKAIWLAM